MAATLLDKFIVSVLTHKDEKSLYRLDKTWLDAVETVRLKYVLDYYKEHAELMGLSDYCTKFRIDEDEGTSRPSLYIRELRDRYIFSEISENVPALLKKVKANPRKVLGELAEMVSELTADDSSTRDTDYGERGDDRLEEYLERVRTGGISYLRLGHPVLDDLFYGLRKTDLVTFGGRAGSKKTFLLCYLAILIEEHLPEEYGDVLFVTNEVPAMEIEERMDAIRFTLPYKRFLAGKLNRPEFRRYEEGIAALKKKKVRIKIIENCLKCEELRAKIKIYNPSACLLDGSYLMEPDMNKPEWEKITYVTRTMKNITNTEKVPIINTTQLKRAGGKSEKGTSFDAQDDFAYSNSYTQDSDIAIRMFAEKEMIFRQEVGLQVAKGRRVEAGVTPIFLCNLNIMQLDFYLSEADVESAEITADLF